MSKTTANLNDLIEVLNDGITFYDDAASSTGNSAYRQLFLRMATSKRAIVNDLKVHVSQHGEQPADGGTIAGALRKTYADVRARMSSDPDAQYIDHLEETEDRILQAFQDGLTTSENAEVRQIAQQYLPDVRRMHHEMRSLKQQVKAA